MEVTCCEFSSKFTPSHLTVWTICSKSEATPSIYWSLGKSPLFFLWHFGLSDFVSVIIREQKGLRKRDYLEKCPGPLNKFPRNWFLHDMISWEHHDALHVSNNWLKVGSAPLYRSHCTFCANILSFKRKSTIRNMFKECSWRHVI